MSQQLALQPQHISVCEVPENERCDILPKYFGPKMMQVEATIFGTLDNLSPDYTGAMWAFYEIPEGFYMAPKIDDDLQIVITGNYFDDTMSADAAGIVTCLFVYSHMSEKYPEDDFADLFHALRDFAGVHAEASKIFSAID
ncbi:antirestriction protein [Kiloniella sp.]|uniref:antirestriction protein n=1 Tax=Kiloniella sp. TaxID=1938587 RepID=UPI003B014A4F